MRRGALAEGLLCAALAGLSLALYRNVLELWWTYDDAFHLRLALSRTSTAILFDRSFWQDLPNPVFTPLLLIAFKADLAAFGIDPWFHYAHHLMFVALVPVFVFMVCRLWVSPWRAFAAGALMAAGPPVCDVAAQLLSRHYVEGLVLALVSGALAVRAFRTQRWFWSILSAFLYTAAMLEKEVYVPLPLVALAIPESTLKARVKYLAPHAGAALIYAVWRLAMLGFALSGYGLTPARGDWPETIATLPIRAWRRLGGADPVAGILFAVALAAAIAFIVIRVPRSRALAVAGVLAALLPIVPVSSQMESRFVLTTWTLVVIACAFFPSRSRWIPLPLILLIVLAFAANRATWAASYSAMKRMSDEGRFYFGMNDDAVLRNPSIPPAAAGELAWLRAHQTGRRGGRVTYDDLVLCTSGNGASFYEYRDARSGVVPTGREFVERTVCRNIRNDLPLQARFSYRDSVLYWTLGPHRDGQYRFILGDGAQAFDVPADAGFRLPEAPGIALRVRYESPAGWITYSPELALDFARRPDLTWHR